MEIIHHNINPKEIVGIGPLMVQRSTDQAVAMLYNSKHLWFWLHLKNTSIKIESDWLSFQGVPDAEIEANKKTYQDFAARYETAKKEILALINTSYTSAEMLRDIANAMENFMEIYSRRRD